MRGNLFHVRVDIAECEYTYTFEQCLETVTDLIDSINDVFVSLSAHINRSFCRDALGSPNGIFTFLTVFALIKPRQIKVILCA